MLVSKIYYINTRIRKTFAAGLESANIRYFRDFRLSTHPPFMIRFWLQSHFSTRKPSYRWL